MSMVWLLRCISSSSGSYFPSL